MEKMFLIFILSALLFVSCAAMPDEYPDDFSLVLEWDTGALPPEYHYQYTISIGPGPQGEFVYHPGYEATPENTWITGFEITETGLQLLYDYLKSNNILRGGWASGQPLVGGQSTSILITAFGQQYLVPSVSEVSRNERELIERTIEEIRSYVPDTIWQEMNERQSDYELNYGS